MTVKYELGLDILKIYLLTVNELSRSRLSKVKTRKSTDTFLLLLL